MRKIVFTSPWQDEVDPGVGLLFKRDEPQLVTDEQAAQLLTQSFFKAVDETRTPSTPPSPPTTKPPAPVPDTSASA